MTSDIVSVEIGRSTWQGPAEEAPWRADNRDADMAECAAFSAGYEAGERDGRASGQQVRALMDAARELIDGASTTYRARNGRQVGIEADDGEKCYIVHSDLMHALEAALTPAPQPSETVAEVIEATNIARNRLEMIADAAWQGDGRDLKRSIAGVFSDFDAALRALTPAPQAATPTAQTKRLEDRTVRSIAEGSTTLLDTEIMQMMAQEIEDHRRTAQEAVAWRCKDYADGWVLYGNKRQAECYQRLTGCLMEALYTHPPQPSETVADVHQRDLTRPIIGIENRTAQEVFDIMSDRIRAALRALKGGAHG